MKYLITKYDQIFHRLLFAPCFIFGYDASMQPMDNDAIQAKCEQFLHELGIPGFIVFGWQKEATAENQTEFGVVSSFHEMPVNAAVKGMTWALSDFVSKSL